MHAEDDTVSVTQVVGPYLVELRYPKGVDAAFPNSLEITPFPHYPKDQLPGITSGLVRRIDFAEAERERQAVEDGKVESFVLDEKAAKQTFEGLRMGDEYLANLAFYYVALVSAGERSVTAKLGELTGKSAATMTDHLKKCRKAGMLTATPGKAGGKLTEKAKALLA